MLEEQTGKIESGFSAAHASGSGSRKPLFEDYVVYAELQRASDDLTDGKR